MYPKSIATRHRNNGASERRLAALRARKKFPFVLCSCVELVIVTNLFTWRQVAFAVSLRCALFRFVKGRFLHSLTTKTAVSEARKMSEPVFSASSCDHFVNRLLFARNFARKKVHFFPPAVLPLRLRRDLATQRRCKH